MSAWSCCSSPFHLRTQLVSQPNRQLLWGCRDGLCTLYDDRISLYAQIYIAAEVDSVGRGRMSGSGVGHAGKPGQAGRRPCCMYLKWAYVMTRYECFRCTNVCIVVCMYKDKQLGLSDRPCGGFGSVANMFLVCARREVVRPGQ